MIDTLATISTVVLTAGGAFGAAGGLVLIVDLERKRRAMKGQ